MNTINFDVLKKLIPLYENLNKYSVFGLYGGRASGKSYEAARAFILICLNETERDIHFGCLRETKTSLEDSCYPLIKELIYESNFEKYFDIKSRNIICKRNNANIIFRGIQERSAPAIKSTHKLKYVLLEEAQEISQKSIDLLVPTVIRNPGYKMFIVWNPLDVDTPIDKRLRKNKPPSTKLININYLDNKHILSSPEAMLEINHMKKTNYADYEHIYLGEYRKVIKNAIWNKVLIDQYRTTSIDKFKFKIICIGVDPSGGDIKKSKKGGNDEHGIVCVGLTYCGKFIILEDKSCYCKPLEASSIVSALYEKYHAGMVIAEKNSGGEYVRTALNMKNREMRVVLVHAIHSKRYRANPVLNLYEKGKIHHHGYFSQLEHQMVSWTEDSKYSPDRLDAMVHAVRYLKGYGNKNVRAISAG